MTKVNHELPISLMHACVCRYSQTRPSTHQRRNGTTPGVMVSGPASTDWHWLCGRRVYEVVNIQCVNGDTVMYICTHMYSSCKNVNGKCFV